MGNMGKIMRLAISGTVLALAGGCATVGGESGPVALPLDTGLLPSVGNCRYWDPGKDASQQEAAFPCSDSTRPRPANAFLLNRTSEDRVTQVIFLKNGGVAERRVYDARSGRYVGQ